MGSCEVVCRPSYCMTPKESQQLHVHLKGFVKVPRVVDKGSRFALCDE